MVDFYVALFFHSVPLGVPMDKKMDDMDIGELNVAIKGCIERAKDENESLSLDEEGELLLKAQELSEEVLWRTGDIRVSTGDNAIDDRVQKHIKAVKDAEVSSRYQKMLKPAS